MTKVLTILLAIFLLIFKKPIQETVFTGKITTEQKYNYLLGGLSIYTKKDSLVLSESMIQPDGSFKISGPAKTEFDIYYRGTGIGNNYVRTIKPTFEDTIQINFELPIKYKKRFGKVVCPKSSKHDQTVPIRYGLGSAIVVMTITSSGDTIYTPYDKRNYYDGGCITSEFSSRYYCKRDELKF